MEHVWFGDQAMLAAVIAWFVEQLKRSSWFPFLTAESNQGAKIMTALISALATAGILVGHNWTGSTHTFTVTISGLTAANFATFCWHAFGQYVYTKIFYHAGIKGMSNGASK